MMAYFKEFLNFFFFIDSFELEEFSVIICITNFWDFITILNLIFYILGIHKGINMDVLFSIIMVVFKDSLNDIFIGTNDFTSALESAVFPSPDVLHSIGKVESPETLESSLYDVSFIAWVILEVNGCLVNFDIFFPMSFVFKYLFSLIVQLYFNSKSMSYFF